MIFFARTILNYSRCLEKNSVVRPWTGSTRCGCFMEEHSVKKRRLWSGTISAEDLSTPKNSRASYCLRADSTVRLSFPNKLPVCCRAVPRRILLKLGCITKQEYENTDLIDKNKWNLLNPLIFIVKCYIRTFTKIF